MTGLDREGVLSVFYERFFGRRADPKGVRNHLAKASACNRDMEWLDRIVSDFVNSKEHHDQMRKMLFEGELFVEHSQFGEVSLLLKHMLREYVRLTASRGFIVDVGANGKKISNSYDLLRHLGFKGLLIEANPRLVEQIREEFADCDVVIHHAAVSHEDGREVTLWVSDDNKDIASIRPERFDAWKRQENFGHLSIDHEYRLVTERLPDILARHAVPEDFFMLTIDIEGVDVDVVNDLLANSRHRPLFLIIEGRSEPLMAAIPRLRAEYGIVAETRSNVIFERGR